MDKVLDSGSVSPWFDTRSHQRWRRKRTIVLESSIGCRIRYWPCHWTMVKHYEAWLTVFKLFMEVNNRQPKHTIMTVTAISNHCIEISGKCKKHWNMGIYQNGWREMSNRKAFIYLRGPIVGNGPTNSNAWFIGVLREIESNRGALISELHACC